MGLGRGQYVGDRGRRELRQRLVLVICELILQDVGIHPVSPGIHHLARKTGE